jgi:hypothetical protein
MRTPSMSASAVHSRERRLKHKTAGKCTECGINSPGDGLDKCELCTAYQIHYNSKRDQARRAAGKCTECGKNSPREGLDTCELCAAYQADWQKALKIETFEAYGGAHCCTCPETRLGCLTLSHINDDGAAHRRAMGVRGTAMYNKLKDLGFPNDPPLCVQCFNCNVLGIKPYVPKQ